MSRKPQGKPVRMRTAQARDKAIAQLDELRASGQVSKAVVIAEMRDGSLQVLGQELRPHEMAPMLAGAAEGLAAVMEQRDEPRLEPRQQPLSTGPTVGLTVQQRGITLDAQGVMQPPAGETIISCGECRHPRWYATVRVPQDEPGRLACAACGNELIWHRIDHAGGRA